jgi:hypothetical protein
MKTKNILDPSGWEQDEEEPEAGEVEAEGGEEDAEEEEPEVEEEDAPDGEDEQAEEEPRQETRADRRRQRGRIIDELEETRRRLAEADARANAYASAMQNVQSLMAPRAPEPKAPTLDDRIGELSQRKIQLEERYAKLEQANALTDKDRLAMKAEYESVNVSIAKEVARQELEALRGEMEQSIRQQVVGQSIQAKYGDVVGDPRAAAYASSTYFQQCAMRGLDPRVANAETAALADEVAKHTRQVFQQARQQPQGRAPVVRDDRVKSRYYGEGTGRTRAAEASRQPELAPDTAKLFEEVYGHLPPKEKAAKRAFVASRQQGKKGT